MYYIGIDGGSAYGKMIGVDEDMKIIGRHMGNTVDPSKLPAEIVWDNLSRLLTEFSKINNLKPEDCKGVCIGVPGGRNPENQERVLEMFQRAGFTCPVKVTTDLDIILATETKGEPGIVVIASTDACAYGVDDSGNPHHCGGWGYLVDNGGSGYGIGIQATKYALMCYDGRLPHTILADKVREHFAVKDLAEVAQHIHSDKISKTKVAELALVVKYAAESGDEYARFIEESAAKELHLLAKSLVSRCKIIDCKIALSGSVFLLNDIIRSSFSKLLKQDLPDAETVVIREKPEMGAVYLCKR